MTDSPFGGIGINMPMNDNRTRAKRVPTRKIEKCTNQRSHSECREGENPMCSECQTNIRRATKRGHK